MQQRLSYRHKIANYHESSFLGLTQKWKKNELQIVFTNGCFDVLHAGHIDYLYKAANRGDRLIVGLNSDASVRGLKGPKRPVNSWEHRAEMLAGLSCVDLIIPFQEETPLQLIIKILPDLLIKGGDYSIETIVGAREVKENGGRVETIPFVHAISTTQLIDKLKQL